MTHYLISEASRELAVEAHVLRYWEEELKLEIPRNELGHRYYTEKQLALFRRIKELKELGYQLKAIKTSLKEEYGPVGADEAGFLMQNSRQKEPMADAEGAEEPKGAEKRFQVLAGQSAEKTAEELHSRSPESAEADRLDSMVRADRLNRLSGRLSASASGPMTEAVLEKLTGRLAEGIGQAGSVGEEADGEACAGQNGSVGALESVSRETDAGLAGSVGRETGAGQAGDAEEAAENGRAEGEAAGASEEAGCREESGAEKEGPEEAAGEEAGRAEDAPETAGERRTGRRETALELVESGSLAASPEKMQQFQNIMTDVLAEALRRNQDILSQEVGGTVSEKLVKEMNYLMRDREEREEERYRKLDETIRACQRVQRQRSEAAATRVPVRGMKKSRFPWGRRKDS